MEGGKHVSYAGHLSLICVQYHLSGTHFFHAGLVVRSKAGRPPSFWAALTTHKQSPIYNIWFSKGGEGENVSVKGTEGTKDTLEALEKGLKSERQAAQSRLARNTGCRRCSVGVHARPRLEFN